MNYQKIYNDLVEKRKEFPYIDGYSDLCKKRINMNSNKVKHLNI